MSDFLVKICMFGAGDKKFVESVDTANNSFTLTDKEEDAKLYSDVFELTHDIDLVEKMNKRRGVLFAFE